MTRLEYLTGAALAGLLASPKHAAGVDPHNAADDARVGARALALAKAAAAALDADEDAATAPTPRPSPPEMPQTPAAPRRR